MTSMMAWGTPFPGLEQSMLGGAGSMGSDYSENARLNPATLRNRARWGVIFEHRSFNHTSSDIYGGFYFPLLSTKILTGIEMFSNEATLNANDYNFAGLGLALGGWRWQRLSFGFSFGYQTINSPGGNEEYQFRPGILYTAESKSGKIFDVHKFHFGLSVPAQYQADGNFIMGPAPGLGLTFLKSKYFETTLYIDFPYKENFVKIATDYGVDLSLFDYVSMRFGAAGDDFFSSENLYGGLILRYQFPSDYHLHLYGAQNLNSLREKNKHILQGDLGINFSWQVKQPEKETEKPAGQQVPLLIFSPNGDGVKDSVSLSLKPELTKGEFWSLVIEKNDKAVYSIANYQLARLQSERQLSEVIWYGQNQQGQIQPDAEYLAKIISLKEEAGLVEEAIYRIIIDTKKPLGLATVSTDTYQFSAGQQPVIFNLKTKWQSLDSASFLLADKDGRHLYETECRPATQKCEISWRPSAEYRLKPQQVFAAYYLTDQAGNQGTVKARPVLIQSRKGALLLRVTPPEITPARLKEKGAIIDLVEGDGGKPVENRFLSFIAEDGKQIDQLNAETLPTRWQPGEGQQPGQVTVVLSTIRKGNQAILATGLLQVISAEQPLKLRLSPTEKFVGGFGRENNMELALEFRPIAGAEKWQLSIVDEFDDTIYSKQGRGEPPRLHYFNGYSDGKNLLDNDRSYQAQFVVNTTYGTIKSNWAEFTTGMHVQPELKDIRLVNFKGLKLAFGRLKSFRLPINTILFFGNEARPMPGYLKVIDQVAPLLKANKNYKIIIEGHVNPIARDYSKRPDLFKFGMRLSKARAQKIKELLIQRGISSSRMTAIGHGPTKPLKQGSSKSAKVKNRRVELVLIADEKPVF